MDPHPPLQDWYFGTSFREKYEECLRKTAEVHGEMLKGLGYWLKRIHKATPNGFQRRLQRPSWCGARGDILREKKFHFIFSIFLHRGFEPTCFHRFFHWGQSSKNWISWNGASQLALARWLETLVKSASVETTTCWWGVPCWLLISVVIVTGWARDGVWCSLWEWGESICEVHFLVARGNVKIAAGQTYVWNAYQLKS